ncbi:4-(cytidine 5'-diphospho)-2-C-methyl-D-erythritol kinase [Ligilactobacillus pabuli]|nr:4-(cytidine 5'-diphospho)-2-C-methyl-D-erythritol kinase [Ligilactobacillus pabuli]
MEITEKAPAKLNLCLDTPFQHRDGHFEWKMVMTAIDLADYVQITTLPHSEQIIVQTDSGFLPCDQRNLTYQAAKKIKSLFHIKTGLKISIQKNIPVAAGMGGGSADAAAVLRALNKLWNLELTNEQLAKIGLSIDSDVPFCVYSRPALVTGRGEIVTPLESLPPMWFVIAKPPASVSTPFILRQVNYHHLDHLDVDQLVAAIHNQDYLAITSQMANVLEPISARRYPEISKIKNKMLQFGTTTALMSGTGPTVYGVCQKYSRAVRVYNSLRGFCEEVYLANPFSLEP